MFNTDISNNQSFNFNINAVSGTLRKSHPKSKMCIKQLKDSLCIFDEEKPRLSRYADEIVILQTMLIGNDRAIIEYVSLNEFQESEDK